MGWMTRFATPRVRERSAERIILASSFMKQSELIWGLVISLVFAIALARSFGLVFIVIWPVYVLYALGELRGNKVVIDKLAESIVVEKRHFLLVHRRRVISFLAVQSVVVQGMSRERYGRFRVFLNIGGKKSNWVKIIDEQADEEGIISLAGEIGEFIGTQSVYLPKP